MQNEQKLEIENSPDYYLPYRNLAHTYITSGDYKLAEKNFTKAIKLDSLTALNWTHRADFYEGLINIDFMDYQMKKNIKKQFQIIVML